MAGKIIELRGILDENVLARRLSSQYSTWLLQRGEKEKEWRELRNYLFATDTTKTSNAKLPWKNSTTGITYMLTIWMPCSQMIIG